MKIPTFELERYFAKYEFSARYMLSSSDCESISMAELLEMAGSETLRLWQELRLGYTETPGHHLLREATSNTYEGVTAEDSLVVVPEEGIFLLMHALLEPGDHVICTYPGYQSLYEVARSIGCTVTKWLPDEENGWYFDPGQLDSMLLSETKLVVANFPHNPTGYLPPKEDFETLVNIVSQKGIHLLSDEMYRYLEVAPDSGLPAACELYDRAYSLSGLSKSYGLPGLRIGWLASRNHEVLERVSRLKDYTTICASAPSEILAIMALRNRDEIVARQLERVRGNLAVLDTFFADYEESISWNRPLGGSIGFPQLLFTESASQFCRQLVEEAGIMLVPSTMFDYGDRHVRFGFGRQDLPEVLDPFAQYLDRMGRG